MVRCVQTNCLYGLGPYPDAAIVLRSSVVTIEENTPPSVSALSVTGLADGWATKSSQISMSGSDQLGLRKLELLDGLTVVSTKAGACVDWSVRPCAEAEVGGGPGLSFDAALPGLASGSHELRARATDAAGNQSVSEPVTVKVDADAPVAGGLSGGGLSNVSTRTLAWNAPGGGSPITAGEVELCSTGDPSRCTTTSVPPAGPFTFDLASYGQASARVRLTDLAGNVGVSASEVFTLDAVAPSPPVVAVSGSNSSSRAFAVSHPGDADVIGYAPRLCRDNTCADLPRQGATGAISAQLGPPGAYRLEVVLIDAAGNMSAPGSTSFTYAAPAPTPTPTPTPPPGVLQSVKLATVLPRKLPKKSVLVRGTVVAGSTGRITVTLEGRRATGKKVRVQRTVKPSARGRFSVHTTLPKRLRRRSGVLITIVATPNDGYKRSVVARRIKP